MEIFYQKKLLEKAATNKSFEYYPSGKELKAQTGIAKEQYKLLKDQENYVIDNNREEDIRKEDKSGKSNITKEFNAILRYKE